MFGNPTRPFEDFPVGPYAPLRVIACPGTVPADTYYPPHIVVRHANFYRLLKNLTPVQSNLTGEQRALLRYRQSPGVEKRINIGKPPVEAFGYARGDMPVKNEKAPDDDAPPPPKPVGGQGGGGMVALAKNIGNFLFASAPKPCRPGETFGCVPGKREDYDYV